MAAWLAAEKADLAASRRRLEQIRAEMNAYGERQWRELFSRVEDVLRRCYSEPRILKDAEAYRILDRLPLCRDLETFHSDLQELSARLAEIAGVRYAARGFEPGRQAGIAEGEAGNMLNLSGRMHLRL